MTNRLLLVRHAKSSWDEPATPDRDRPLAKRGRSAAARLGAHLRSSGLLPDLVLCSSALRTRRTLELLGLPDTHERFEDRLYGASDREILACIREMAGASRTLLVIGHNPGMQDLAVELVGPELDEAAVRLRERFPTCALASFEIEGAWHELGPGRARLSSFVVPKDLG